MSVLSPSVIGESVRFFEDACVTAGQDGAAQYRSADPFPHIVLDNFLPVEVLRRVIDEFPQRQPGKFSNAQSDLKTGYQLEMIESDFITNMFSAFNSRAFVRYLEELTGIPALIPDPHYAGGGLHETANGGYLKIHADFNRHPEYELTRRLNLILFLNENWSPEYGGGLELWDLPLTRCVRRVEPVMGRAVIFNTTETSWHGHPEPLTCPPGVFRRSMALYYFTTMEGDAPRSRSTTFVSRPGTEDEPTTGLERRWKGRAKDLCPPALWRRIEAARRSS